LLLLMLGIGLVPLLLTGIVSLILTSQSLEDRAIENERTHLDNQAADIQRFLDTSVSDLLILSNLRSLRELAAAINARDSIELQELREGVEAEFQHFAAQRTAEDASIYQHIRFLDDEGFEFVRVDNVDGEIQRAIAPGLNVRSGADYFRQARGLGLGEIFVTPVELFDEFGRISRPYIPVLRYSTPIFVDDNVIGVLVTDVRAQGFLDFATEALVEEGTSFLVDESGYYLAHPDESLTFGRDLGTEIRLQDDYPELSARITRQEMQVIELPEDIAIMRPVFMQGGFTWTLVSLRPRSSINETLQQQQIILIGGLIVAALVVAMIAYGFARSISQPIAALTEEAAFIAAGEYDRVVKIERSDEIGMLGIAFNKMAESLYVQVNRLNEKNRALSIATAEAREAARLKSEFLAVMSHELRTPLNAILGFLGIITLQGGLSEKQRHMIDRISANSQRLLNLIHDVLDISRIESGRMELVPNTIDIRQLVNQIHAQMDVLAEEKHLDFTCHVDSAVAQTIHADEDALLRIISNLLSNAFKFTEEGRVALNVHNDADRLLLEVSDTGIGIPAHLHEIIFESFRQADSSSKREYGGTGLGLAIVQHLTNAMQGSVRVESTPGKGSIFYVTLPIRTGEPIL
jgi:signal transduction histidine kinase